MRSASLFRIATAILSLLAAASAAEAARPPVMCTMEYRPVCGFRDGRWRTFSNRCQAIAARAGRIRMGTCPGR